LFNNNITDTIFGNCLTKVVTGDVLKLVAGAMSTSLLTLALYSGLSDKQTNAIVAPKE